MNAKMNFGQKNGVFFEELFLSKLQEHMKVQSSDGTRFKYCCDIVADDCLVEVKSHRDWKQTQTTQQVLTSITQSSVNKYSSNGVPCGLLLQLSNLFKEVKEYNKKAMVIAGVYSEEVNQLYQVFLKDGDKAFGKYKFYDILLMDQDWSGLCRISSKDFWSFVKGNSSHVFVKLDGLIDLFREFRHHIESKDPTQKLLNSSMYHDTIGAIDEVLKYCTIREVDEQQRNLELNYSDYSWGHDNVQTWGQNTTEEKQPEINIENQQLQINIDKPTQTWIEKEKQAKAQAEPVEAVAEPVEVVAERTDGYTYPIIEQDKWNNHKIFEPENLKKIEDGIRNQVRLRDLSLELGYSNVYLTGTITSNESYKSENWVTYKKWILNLMDEVDYNHKPTASIESIEEAQKQVRKYRTQVSNFEIKLEKQDKKHKEKIHQIRQELDHQNKNKLVIAAQTERLNSMIELHTKQRNEINDLKAKLNSQETNQVDETTTLKLEAYQAEIKKLQTQLEELQEAFDKLIDEAVTMNLEIKDQKLEIEQLKASSSVIKDQQIIDSLLLLIEKLK